LNSNLSSNYSADYERYMKKSIPELKASLLERQKYFTSANVKDTLRCRLFAAEHESMFHMFLSSLNKEKLIRISEDLGNAKKGSSTTLKEGIASKLSVKSLEESETHYPKGT